MKTCTLCGEAKPLSDFPPRGNGHLGWCRPCKREYDRDYYAKTADVRRRQRSVTIAALRKRNKQKRLQYLTEHPCVDCGESDPIVLEFDHVRGAKSRNVSDMVGGEWSWTTVMLEIAKCDVRCANCHRRATHQRRLAA